MASGETITSAISDSLDTVMSAARQVQEHEGVISKLCDVKTLGENIGETWREISYAKLTASSITETSWSDNYQQISDTALTITPTQIEVVTLITDVVGRRVNKAGLAQMVTLGQNAIERKKDLDGLTAGAAGTALGGAGNTMLSGYISAATARILGNASEKGSPPLRAVLHPYHIKDLFDELVAGVGTYVLTEGPTARVFQEGFKLPVAGCEVYGDGNMSVDSSDDAVGCVFTQKGLILVQGKAPWKVAQREERYAGGSTRVFHRDEYAYGERSSGNWVYAVTADATAPTS